jgi:hypothetical protein
LSQSSCSDEKFIIPVESGLMMPERLLLASGGHYPSGVVYTLVSNGTDKIIHDRQVHSEIQPLSV